MSTVTELRHPSSMSARPRVLFPWSTNACPRPISTTASRLATPRFPRRQSQDAPQHPNLQKAVKDERRRRMYLEKVQQKAEDKKWGARSEQVWGSHDSSSRLSLTQHARYFERISWLLNDSGLSRKAVRRLLPWTIRATTIWRG